MPPIRTQMARNPLARATRAHASNVMVSKVHASTVQASKVQAPTIGMPACLARVIRVPALRMPVLRLPVPRTLRALSAPLVIAALLAGGCARSQTHPGDAQAGTPPAPRGAIEGRILHPAHAVPALRICAIGSGAPAEAKHACIDTRPGQATYRIEGLPPDDYIVVATGGSAPYRVGGHMQQVQCIRAPCPDMPASVAIAAGATATGIDLNGFYERRDDFPAMPAGR